MQSLSLLCWGLATLRHQPGDGLLDAASARVAQLASGQQAQQAAQQHGSMGQHGAAPAGEQLEEEGEEGESLSVAEGGALQALSLVAWAYASWGHSDARLHAAVRRCLLMEAAAEEPAPQSIPGPGVVPSEQRQSSAGEPEGSSSWESEGGEPASSSASSGGGRRPQRSGAQQRVLRGLAPATVSNFAWALGKQGQRDTELLRTLRSSAEANMHRQARAPSASMPACMNCVHCDRSGAVAAACCGAACRLAAHRTLNRSLQLCRGPQSQWMRVRHHAAPLLDPPAAGTMPRSSQTCSGATRRWRCSRPTASSPPRPARSPRSWRAATQAWRPWPPFRWRGCGASSCVPSSVPSSVVRVGRCCTRGFFFLLLLVGCPPGSSAGLHPPCSVAGAFGSGWVRGAKALAAAPAAAAAAAGFSPPRVSWRPLCAVWQRQ